MDSLWNVMAGGAVLGVLASCWGKIKEFFWRIANLFVQQAEITSEYAHNALVGHLVSKYRRSRLYDRVYGAWYEHQRDGRYGLVSYEIFGNRGIVFWQGWVPFFFSNAALAKKGDKDANESNATKTFSRITYLRGTLDVEAILAEACHSSNRQSWAVESKEAEKSRFVIHYVPKRTSENQEWGQNNANGLAWYQQGMYRLLTHTPDQLGKAPLHDGKALETLIFPRRIKNLITEIELWRNFRDWYRDKGIPWKRGWLLYGPPGTGKTALARAFAEDLNLPIYVFHLAQMSNADLTKAWSEMQVNVPCIALIEDIDNVFHGRENVARRGSFMPFMVQTEKKDDDSKPAGSAPMTPLTFDCLLNCLDGVERSDGIFTIITTNDLSKIDPALGLPRKLPDGATEFISTRPGRIDKAVELTYMDPADKKVLAKRILGEYPQQYKETLEFIDRFPDLQETPAQFQERCGQIALAQFWKEQQAHDQKQPEKMPEQWQLVG